jgi:hypothetical protein
MRHAAVRRALVVALPCLASCGTIAELPDQQGILPVVEAILYEDQEVVRVFVGWTGTGLNPAILPRPAEVTEVQLVIRDPSGAAHPVIPTGDLGHFQAALRPEPGGRYRLSGTVGGVALSAETVMPRSFNLLEPVADTLAADGSVFRFAYAYDSDAYGVVVPEISTYEALPSRGEVTAIQPSPDPISTYRFVAADPYAFFALTFSEPLPSNVAGGFGVFGAALVRSRVIRWP